MTDRMGTVVEDSGSPAAGSSVTGFFRLTGKGVEIRYSDGRSAHVVEPIPMAACRWCWTANIRGSLPRLVSRPDGVFSEAEKKMALNAYATRLGLPVSASDTSNGCSASASAQPASISPSTPVPGAIAPSTVTPKAKLERHVQAKPPQAHVAKASYHIGDYQPAANPKAGLDAVEISEGDSAARRAA